MKGWIEIHVNSEIIKGYCVLKSHILNVYSESLDSPNTLNSIEQSIDSSDNDSSIPSQNSDEISNNVYENNQNERKLLHRIVISPKSKITILQNGTIMFYNTYDSLITLKTAPGTEKKWADELLKHKISLNEFKILKMIGKGYFGKVFLAQKRDNGKLYALKSIPKSRALRFDRHHTTLAESDILVHITYPFIVPVYYSFQNTNNFYICMEYVAGGELFYRMRKCGVIPLEDARLYIAEVALALNHLHSMGIVYRDLKPENVLLDLDGHVRLIDFGLAKELTGDQNESHFCGTPDYLAPEIVSHQKYSRQVDWWALGVLLYEMMFKRTPFYAVDKERMFQKIVSRNIAIPSRADNNLANLLNGLLQKDPKKRYRFKDIKNHPFFEGLNFDDVEQKKIEPNYKPHKFDPDEPDYQKLKLESNDTFDTIRRVSSSSFSSDTKINKIMNGEEEDQKEMTLIYS
ncbi:AGC family protein kinase [Tritrichomonas foetus]|uniref:AGC family protein kinase n=1 Tax=Tritrichomonas foetus TaxID=1144522 RepID=A0A1J4J114_9EUKA|nr:AGC family protein kinase [Tritrichomonas foetus]|eukprot:OHS93294.1 AGC family protein kinase [Tritrichomonas foetus]